MMRARRLLVLLCLLAAWPAAAQQPEGMRRVGILVPRSTDRKIDSREAASRMLRRYDACKCPDRGLHEIGVGF